MIATVQRKPLGQLLIDKGLIKPEQLDRALDEQRRSNHQKLLGEVLVEMRFCTEDQITEALAQAYGVPYARVSPRIADPKVISVLPKDFLEKHQILPLYLVEGVLTVAVPEPANVFLLEEIERLGGYAVQVVAATARDIRATLQTYLPDDKVFVIDDIIEEVNPDEFSLIEQPVQDLANLEQAAGDSPVIKLVNYCIYNAVKEGASDIHIEPSDNLVRIRYRIDGRLTERLRPPMQMHAAVASRIKIMAGLDISERRLPQDGGIHVMMDKRPIDLRVSTMPGKHGEKVVIRIIDNERASVNLEKLGFGYDTLKQFKKLVSLPNGIVLVTGPTGSGKSTTLYACLQEINSDDINICTIEDPVEYAVGGINQFQVNDKAGFTFASALRSLLRQDPDVIMVGEIRDAETARIASSAHRSGKSARTAAATGNRPGATRAETWLAASTFGKSPSSPSLRSIAADAPDRRSNDPSSRRGSGRRWASINAPAVAARRRGSSGSSSSNAKPAADAPIVPLTATTSPTRAPDRVRTRPPTVSPIAVTCSVIAVGERTMSPPAITVPLPAASAPSAAYIARRSATDSSPRNPRVTTATRGTAPIDARSERFTASVLWPRLAGSVQSVRKCTPSTRLSVVTTTDSPADGVQTAQSSPIPIGTCGDSAAAAGSAERNSAISPNSPTSATVGGGPSQPLTLLPGGAGASGAEPRWLVRFGQRPHHATSPGDFRGNWRVQPLSAR